MSGPGSTVRDGARVAREYGEKKWPAVERTIAEVTAREEPGATLARVVAAVARNDWFGATSPSAEADAVVGGKLVRMPQSAAMGAYQHLVVETLLEACEPAPELVVELGAGWGRNLCSLWLAGAPREARYVAAEYTDAGRRAAERLAALEPELRLESHPFDFTSADLSALGRVERALVFSVHAIEQVPHVERPLFDAVRGLAQEVTCFHFEPVGWQCEGEREGSSAEHAEKHDYNRNLVPVLREEEAAGLLELTELRPDVLGVTPFNATTLIGWRSGAG
jgi:hypothetical protein